MSRNGRSRLMESVFWVVPDMLAGRPGPDYAPWSLEVLYAGGIRAVINLSEFEPSYAEFDAVNITVDWIPLPNSYPADADAERACLEKLPGALSLLQSHLYADKAVLVHCAWGRDRTGLLLAYFLANENRCAPDEAIAQVREVCPKALSATGWDQMAVRIIKNLM